LWSGLDSLPDTSAGGARFEPRMGGSERSRLLARWDDALSRTLSGPRG